MTAILLAVFIAAIAADDAGRIRVLGENVSRVFQPDGQAVGGEEKRSAAPAARGEFSRAANLWAYLGGSGNDVLYVADADGKNERRISPEGMAAGAYAWSPDGKTLALTAYPQAAPGTFQSAHWQLYTVAADGRNWKPAAASPHGAHLPRFAPDGRLSWLRYSRPLGKAQPADLVVADGEEIKVLVKDTYISDYVWSPSGERVAYGTIGGLGFVEVATGKQQLVALADIDADLASHAPCELVFRPDSQAVVCRAIFIGGRMNGGPAMFGDDKVFILSRTEKPTWFRPGLAVERLEWTR